MKTNKPLKLGIFFLIGILLLTSFVMAYYRSQTNYFQYSPSRTGSFGEFDRKQCEAGQDFIIQIAPFGCDPGIVRSDLLEDTNVPVYCQLAATKMNPLIDVEAINTISITGRNYSRQEVATIGFHPAQAALSPYQNELTTPVVMENIGYVVIVLKRQENESAMPDFIEGSLNAKIRYDVRNAFGVGQAMFYLPVLTDEAWEQKYLQYGFWNGRAYLRAEGVEGDRATISIYSDQYRRGVLGQSSEKRLYQAPITLREGEESPDMYVPGFDYCLATMRLILHDVMNPDERARFKINSDYVEVTQTERFLENRCWVSSLGREGINQEVQIRCNEDIEGNNKWPVTLQITPRVVLNKGGDNEIEVEVGDYLYRDGDKNVFLAYVGTKKGSSKEEDMYAYLIAIPDSEKVDKRLTLNEIKAAKKIAEGYRSESEAGQRTFKTWLGEVGGFMVGVSSNFVNWLADGENFKSIDYEEVSKMFGEQIKLVGFASSTDYALSQEVEFEFKAAMEDYREIVNSFSNEDNPDEKDMALGESALLNMIELAENTGQKKTMSNLCLEFEETYGSESLPLDCKDKEKLSSSGISTIDVLIDGKLKTISFEGIYIPSKEEYSAEVIIKGPNGYSSTLTLTKKDQRYFKGTNEYVELIDLKEDSAKLRIYIKKIVNGVEDYDYYEPWIALSSSRSFGDGYTFSVSEIHLEKVARVSVEPNIKWAGTNATFNFKIPIDKRDIKLTPEKTEERIEKLNREIEKWSVISDKLGSFVKDMTSVCLGTSAVLVVKNYLENLDGKGIARERVMRGENGWYRRCSEWINEGVVRAGGEGQAYRTPDECLIKEADNIDAEVEVMHGFMSDLNGDLGAMQELYVLSGETLFAGDRINTSGLVKDYSTEYTKDFEGDLSSYIINGELKDPKGKSDAINIRNMKNTLSAEGFEANNYDLEQLREIDLYTRILASDASEDFKKIAEENLYSTFLEIQTTSKDYVLSTSIFSELRDAKIELGVSSYGDVESIKGVYSGETILGAKILSEGSQLPNLNATTKYPAEIITYNSEKYLVILNGENREYVVDYIYEYKGVSNGKILVGERVEVIEGKFSGFQKYDDSAYQNTYKNYEVRYYETAPYAGYPAVVPFDIKDGWYVATRQTLPVFGGIRAYDESGRVVSFYLCNVGRNGLEEFIGGDDDCEMINTMTGQSYTQFPGISNPAKTASLVRAASSAVQQAQTQRLRKAGITKVTISTAFGRNLNIPVGNPAIDVPEIQCQDFMSPKDCNIIFNVCDPVICPSSRCNFGGKHYVKDVVQSGIIGSIALCLPNYRENIHIPVCLTGVSAGIDGLLSVFTAYRDCLQESLDTGQTVGICDELHSVYLCESLYRQAAPIAKLGIPKLTEAITGKKGSRGGGEYLGVADAWAKAEQSVNYLAQFYGRNAYEAFKARSVEEAGVSLVCKTGISLVYPNGGNLLDAITTPQSPVQFNARFDEIPFTSVTNPPMSHYKVYYHIYAGNDRGAYYRVYLKGDSSSSFYQDTLMRVDIATGYIGVGDYADEAIDRLLPSGYKELCVMVNGQEECGFKQVSTSFAADYIRDSYVAQQANQTNIKTESTCISGSASLGSLLSPNIQAGAEEALNPSIYNRGIIRICATDNPGKGTDVSGVQKPRWVEVGYCGERNMKCWLDTQSVEKVIEFTNLEEGVLNTTTQNYMDILKNEEGYLSVGEFNDEKKKINNEETSNRDKIELVNKIINKVLYNNQKAYLLYLRGNAYAELAIINYKKFREGQKEEDLAEKGREEIIEEGEKVVKIMTSPKFEIKRGGRNFCAKYFQGDWYWSLDCRDVGKEPREVGGYLVTTTTATSNWIPVTSLTNTEGRDPNKEDQGLIKSLRKIDFDKGMDILIDTALEERKLSGGNAEMSKDKIFVINFQNLRRVKFKYSIGEGLWLWSYRATKDTLKGAWQPVTNTTNLILAANLNFYEKELLASLKDKNQYDGIKFLFWIGFEVKEGEEKFYDGVEALQEGEEEEEEEETTTEEDQEIVKTLEELRDLLEVQTGILHWENWDDVVVYLPQFSNKEKNVILNAEDCDECGKGLFNKCDIKECIAIGFQLKYKSCAYVWFDALDNYKCEEVVLEEETEEETGDLNIPGGVTCPAPPEVTPDIEAIDSVNLKVTEKADTLVGTFVPENLDADSNDVTNCFDPVKYTYDSAGVGASCTYSDKVGKEYNVFGTTIRTEEAPIDSTVSYPSFAVNENCPNVDLDETKKLKLIDKGSLLSYAYDSGQGHSVIFIDWDPVLPIAKVFGWKKSGTGHIFNYSIVDLSDDEHPVYMIWKPELT